MKAYCKFYNLKDINVVAITSGANMNFDRLRLVTELANVGRQQEAMLATFMPESSASFKQFGELAFYLKKLVKMREFSNSIQLACLAQSGDTYFLSSDTNIFSIGSASIYPHLVSLIKRAGHTGSSSGELQGKIRIPTICLLESCCRNGYFKRFKQEEVKIQAWESDEKRKSEPEIKRMEDVIEFLTSPNNPDGALVCPSSLSKGMSKSIPAPLVATAISSLAAISMAFNANSELSHILDERNRRLLFGHSESSTRLRMSGTTAAHTDEAAPSNGSPSVGQNGEGTSCVQNEVRSCLS
ncbi:hypothetical protein Tco_1264548, partial [Tanacetum coccineum]